MNQYRYPNKRVVKRVGGRFARIEVEDVGIGGVCPRCQHLLLVSYIEAEIEVETRRKTARAVTVLESLAQAVAKAPVAAEGRSA